MDAGVLVIDTSEDVSPPDDGAGPIVITAERVVRSWPRVR